METVLILAAVAALAVSGVTVAAMGSRSRRPSLRLPHEDAIDEASEDGSMEEFESPLPSPIDRSGTVLDLEPIEAPRPGEAPSPRRLGSRVSDR
jgi:hypothetical protein